jgi:sigma-B regulation protein RsbU (phosphoserine phosphatase)
MKVSTGEFDVSVPVRANDEIGSLSTAFNKMTDEITRLIKETVDKARMEKEIETAQLVQDNFIPDNYLEVGQLEFASYFKPASECGGDWWGYQKSEDSVIVMLGDATGHGVGPALITSAVYSCNATLSWLIKNNLMGELSPAQIMSAFNTAVCQAGRGKIKMTFFIAKINTTTGEMLYCNASHEMPVTCPPTPESGEKFKLSDLEPLVGTPGPCLGQDEDASYEEYPFHISDGNKMIIYTDGITECMNEEDDEYGETRFFRSVFKSAHLGAADVKNSIIERMQNFHGSRMMDDDITLVVVNKKAQQNLQREVG